jgi:hypothetical protein
MQSLPNIVEQISKNCVEWSALQESNLNDLTDLNGGEKVYLIETN